MEERLGKIERASFGLGGYQEAEIGLSVTLGDGSWGVQDWKGTWAMKRSDHCEWTEDERIKILGETVMFLNDLLKKAKVNDVAGLVGIPVRVFFEGNALKEWEILTEVL